ncbi:Cna B-type domain-containing protein, partial [Prevotella fusca]
LTKDNNWTDSFKNLDEYNGNKKVKYTIKEVKVENGYTSVTTGSAENGFTVTNTREPEKTKVEGEKTWDDSNNQDKKRPKEIKVNLLKNGTKFKSTTVKPDAGGKWKYIFTDLPKYEKGKIIKYSVEEEAVAGYTPTVNGYNITNSYKPEETSVKVTKKWDDADNQDGKRPKSIKVQLYGDNKKVGDEVTLNGGNGWTHTWTKLPKNADGNPINYIVKEVEKVEHYTTSYGNDSQGNVVITNKHTPEKTKVEGEKTWNDAGNQDGKRPKEITVNLLADGQPIQNKDVKPDGDGNWKYSFTDLDKYKDGKPIKYTVTEDVVAEYTPEITGYNIKNSYTPKKTSVTVTKNWDDANNQDGKRPNSIKVQLYGDDEKVGDEVELKKATGWTHTWNDLPEKKAGKTIKYTVKEVGTVDGYTTTYNNENQGNIIICNKHTPEKTKVEGKKTWEDNNDQDKKRPTKIKVNLLADGQIIQSKEVTPDADGNWKYEFTDLDKNKDGEPIQYTVKEEPVAGYTSTVNGYNITNSYKPEETSVKVTKKWEDADNQDGKRPENIKVQLYGNDKKVGDE